MVKQIDKKLEQFELILNFSKNALQFLEGSQKQFREIEVGISLAQTFFDLLDIMRLEDKNFENNFFDYAGHDVLQIEKNLCVLIENHYKTC